MRFCGLFLTILTAGCATALRPIPTLWRTVPEAPRITDLCSRVKCVEKAKADVRVEGGRLMAGNKALTPAFAAIDSFDVSLERREIVFSAKRTDNFDAGLVSLDGSDIHWIPAEPVDETDVQWAPRGNKVSYIVHAARGDLVRTVHVLTASQLSVDFPDGQVDMVAWEPEAERYAVVVESPDASQRVESTKYGGEERRGLLPPPPEAGRGRAAPGGGGPRRPPPPPRENTRPAARRGGGGGGGGGVGGAGPGGGERAGTPPGAGTPKVRGGGGGGSSPPPR